MNVKGLIIGGILLLFTSVYFSTYKILEHKAGRLPENSPRICKEQAGRPRVLVLGDSITHGRVSADYVAILDGLPGQEFEFINAGINGHLAYEVLRRLDKTLAICRPVAVLLMIGTNDVNATFRKKEGDDGTRQGRLPRSPNLEWYRENLQKILDVLRRAGIEKVAVYTIPLIGEEIDSPKNRRVSVYNTAIFATAREAGVQVLDLYGTMADFMQGRVVSSLCRRETYLTQFAVFQNYVLGRSWNEISASLGFHLTTDCLHFNERAAAMIAGLAAPLLIEWATAD